MIDQPPAPTAIVYQSCDEASATLAKVAEGTSVTILSSLAGGGQTCYKIRFTTQDGKPVIGYVIGAKLPEVAAYEAGRQASLRSFKWAPPPAPAPAEPPKPAAAPDAPGAAEKPGNRGSLPPVPPKPAKPFRPDDWD